MGGTGSRTVTKKEEEKSSSAVYSVEKLSNELKQKKLGNLYSVSEIESSFYEFFTEAAPQFGYKEEVSGSNLRIAIGLVGCVLALIAHFILKLETQRGLLGATVLAYFLLNGVLLGCELFTVKGTLMTLVGKDGKVLVDADMRSSDDAVVLQLRRHPGPQVSKTPTGKPPVSENTPSGQVCSDSVTGSVCISRSCGYYFDSEGYLHLPHMLADAAALFSEHRKIGTSSKGGKKE